MLGRWGHTIYLVGLATLCSAVSASYGLAIARGWIVVQAVLGVVYTAMQLGTVLRVAESAPEDRTQHVWAVALGTSLGSTIAVSLFHGETML